ncbi:DgyrCDS9762 [Dimorphilus gyrociliatus]|uniref:DgyrCDS9762 n=1 Tax=Dimorphilus gyrociliatus TaxID=2664684 RepID=A0A7I8W387_9ANNE|nr:DgyrCDS9762 [Dimorphilus gyrociliatus]
MMIRGCNRSRMNSGYQDSSFYKGKFPEKLWSLVNNCRSGAISWSKEGDRICLNTEEFEKQYMRVGGLFQARQVSSFIRQLNLYGFRKVNIGLYKKNRENFKEFQNENFLRNRPELLQFVKRKNRPGSLERTDSPDGNDLKNISKTSGFDSSFEDKPEKLQPEHQSSSSHFNGKLPEMVHIISDSQSDCHSRPSVQKVPVSLLQRDSKMEDFSYSGGEAPLEISSSSEADDTSPIDLSQVSRLNPKVWSTFYDLQGNMLYLLKDFAAYKPALIKMLDSTYETNKEDHSFYIEVHSVGRGEGQVRVPLFLQINATLRIKFAALSWNFGKRTVELMPLDDLTTFYPSIPHPDSYRFKKTIIFVVKSPTDLKAVCGRDIRKILPDATWNKIIAADNYNFDTSDKDIDEREKEKMASTIKHLSYFGSKAQFNMLLELLKMIDGRDFNFNISSYLKQSFDPFHDVGIFRLLQCFTVIDGVRQSQGN